MPRKPRMESKTGYYHWMSRGLNKKKLFHAHRDFRSFLDLVQEYKRRYDIDIHHYCIMPNHIHLLMRTPNIDCLVKFSHFILRRYAYYYCKAHGWRGQVFQRMYRSLPIEDAAYLLECGRYIERNPVRAELAAQPKEWPYSSYRYYSNDKGDPLLTPSPAFLGMSRSRRNRRKAYREYVSVDRVYEKLIDKALLSNLSPRDDVRSG